MYDESFRSPWSNTYFPPVEAEEGAEDDVIYPSSDLLEMEKLANEVFVRYAKMYYDENYLTSVYFFDTDDNGFGSCWLVKKSKSYPYLTPYRPGFPRLWRRQHLGRNPRSKDDFRRLKQSQVQSNDDSVPDTNELKPSPRQGGHGWKRD